MRVIAGKYRSRPLRSVSGRDIRPTSDRLRETLFNVVAAGNPSALAGSVWLDLFAGTGAVGIEALSRGADMVYFVDSSPAAVKLIRRNLDLLGVERGFRLLSLDVQHALRELEQRGVVADFVFLDPPYSQENAYTLTLGTLSASSQLRPGSTVVAEHPKKFDPGERFSSLLRFRRLEQGDAALSFYHWRSGAVPEPALEEPRS